MVSAQLYSKNLSHLTGRSGGENTPFLRPTVLKEIMLIKVHSGGRSVMTRNDGVSAGDFNSKGLLDGGCAEVWDVGAWALPPSGLRPSFFNSLHPVTFASTSSEVTRVRDDQTWEMAQSIKCLFCKNENPSWIPRSHSKNQTWWHVLMILTMGVGDRKILGACSSIKSACQSRWVAGQGETLSQK